jgi:hypothetical protein
LNSATQWTNRTRVPHPLLATRVGNLLDCFREYGWPDARFRFCVRALNLLLLSVLRTPLHHLEGWRVRERVETQLLTGPPIFIIGHWRSGTTHLHQLLTQDPQFGFVTLMQASFPLDFLTSIGGPLLAALLPSNRLVDAVRVTLDSPWEEEMAMACFGPLSFFHTFFFPRHGRRIYRETVHFDSISAERVEEWWRDYRYFLKKVQCAQPGRRLVLKNPANSARVAALRERFPGAKFIHIHRHPEEVYASTVFLHRKAQQVWGLQEDDSANLRQTVLENYADLMTACFGQTRGMRDNELIEVRMSELETNPLATLESIYHQLELPRFEAVTDRFAAYLDKVGLFSKNRLSLGADERDAVRLKLAHVFERLGYE